MGEMIANSCKEEPEECMRSHDFREQESPAMINLAMEPPDEAFDPTVLTPCSCSTHPSPSPVSPQLDGLPDRLEPSMLSSRHAHPIS